MTDNLGSAAVKHGDMCHVTGKTESVKPNNLLGPKKLGSNNPLAMNNLGDLNPVILGSGGIGIPELGPPETLNADSVD